jgi:dolichyl-phosphate-mannose--protein O-mannosyl transferase
LKGGDVIRLFHQEYDGFIRADHKKLMDRDDFEVYLKLTNGGKNKTRNTNTMWQVELQDSMKGGYVTWDSRVRLKHLGTGKYLAIAEKTGNMHLTTKIHSYLTLFVFSPIESYIKVTRY